MAPTLFKITMELLIMQVFVVVVFFLLMSVIFWVNLLSYVEGGNVWRCVTQTFYDFLN